MKFSKDNSLFGYLTRKEVSIYNVKENSLIFSHSEENRKLNLTSFDIAPTIDLVILGLEEDKGRGFPDRHTKGIVSLFDLKGDLLWQDEIHYSRLQISVPDVCFEKENSFRVRTVEEVYEYRY